MTFQGRMRNYTDTMKNNLKNFMKMICIFSLIYFSPYYGGFSIVFSSVSLIIYFSVKLLVKLSYFKFNEVIAAIFSFLGILFTHLSTASIIIFYLNIFLILAVYSASLNIGNKKVLNYLSKLYGIIFIFSLLFVAYEIFVGVSTIKGHFLDFLENIISKLFIEQIEILKDRIDIYRISYIEVMMYVLSLYFKPISLISLNLILIFIYLYDHTIRRKSRFSDVFILIYFLFLISSSSTWILGWLVLGNFFSGRRSIMLYQIFTLLGLCNLFESIDQSKNRKVVLPFRKLYRIFVIICLLLLSIFSFIANFEMINISPTLTYNQDKYKPESHGPISEFVLTSVRYINTYASDALVCGIPEFLSIGYIDLFWYPKKISFYIGDKTDKAIKSLQNLVRDNMSKKSIVPLPLSYQVVPFKYSYRSFYNYSFRFLSEVSSLIYNNWYFFWFYL